MATDQNKSIDHGQELTAERSAQVDSVLRIIRQTIEKLKISLLLPQILQNPITIRQHLGGTKYDTAVKLLETYVRTRKNNDLNEMPHLNYNLIKLIDYFHENFEMTSLLPESLSTLKEEDSALLESFYMLCDVAAQRLRRTAASELVKEKRVHQMYHENEAIKRTIRTLQAKLKNQKINLRWKIAAKDGIIQKYEEDLAIKKWDNSLRVKQEITKSAQQIRTLHNSNQVKLKELEEELEKTKASYEKILKDNLKQEKDTRDEKNKLLLQLQSLIKKYDQVIGDKIKENMDLQESYENQKKEFDEFMIHFQREEAEYEAVVVAREEEEKRKFEEKLMLFMMNRAAKIIQRYWRRYRRAQKKKAKKGKGKKK